MKKTRLSLFYLAGYLIPSGLLLLVAPQFTLKLLFSTGEYGDVFPRLVGAILVVLGLIVAQIIRLRVEALYTTTLIVRAFLLVCLFGFFLYSRDPFFLVLVVVVGFGFFLTTTGYLLDRQSKTG